MRLESEREAALAKEAEQRKVRPAGGRVAVGAAGWASTAGGCLPEQRAVELGVEAQGSKAAGK
jgi:hypothetical protein